AYTQRVCVGNKRQSPALTDRFLGVTEHPRPLSQRQMNRLRIIETLYRHPGIGRAQLARRTRLSRATVSTLVEELSRAGVVQESGEEERPRGTGRPPILLSLVPGSAYAVGLDFGHQHIRVAVCDLSGE